MAWSNFCYTKMHNEIVDISQLVVVIPIFVVVIILKRSGIGRDIELKWL